MINRKLVPPLQKISTFDYLLPEQWELSNGIKVWGINAGSQELVKIDLMFEAGTWYQTQNLIAGLSNAFMNQGSQNYSAQEIAEAFDFRGAYLQLSADQQFGNVTILTLNKYIDDVLKIAADVIKNPTFPEKEINAQIGKKKQQFIIENNKVKTLAQKKFSQMIYGKGHPYANSNKIEDYDNLSRSVFMDFHHRHYKAQNCRIIVAGQYDDRFKAALNKYFGGNDWLAVNELINPKYTIARVDGKVYFVEKEDALQSAIRIGRIFPNREHPDFHGLNVLITLLGGYFGSRLMTNIREDKGYTYGIGAGIYSLPNAAYLTISTEVGTDVTQAALKEIYYEIERFQNELVSEEELETVRNYLLGENLRSFDGIFAMSGSLKVLLEADLGYDHFDDFVRVTKNITAQELMQLARTYLQKEDLIEVVAGKK